MPSSRALAASAFLACALGCESPCHDTGNVDALGLMHLRLVQDCGEARECALTMPTGSIEFQADEHCLRAGARVEGRINGELITIHGEGGDVYSSGHTLGSRNNACECAPVTSSTVSFARSPGEPVTFEIGSQRFVVSADTRLQVALPQALPALPDDQIEIHVPEGSQGTLRFDLELPLVAGQIVNLGSIWLPSAEEPVFQFHVPLGRQTPIAAGTYSARVRWEPLAQSCDGRWGCQLDTELTLTLPIVYP